MSIIMNNEDYKKLVNDSIKLGELLDEWSKSVVMSDEEYGKLVGKSIKLEGLLEELYGLVSVVTNNDKFREWKIRAGYFLNIDLDIGDIYWVKRKDSNRWELCEIILYCDVKGMNILVDGTRVELSKLNGLEYEFIKVEKPV